MSQTHGKISNYSTPQRVSRIGYVIILLTFGVCGGWASYAKIDSATVAPGTVELEGHRKVVQHLEGGIIQAIHIQEADSVKEGDVLVTLESIEASSNMERIRNRLQEAMAIEARLLAEQALESTISFPTSLSNTPSEALQKVLKLQRIILADRVSIFSSEKELLLFRIEQLEGQQAGLRLQKDALERRLELQVALVERLSRGAASGVVQNNLLTRRKDEMIQVEASLGGAISDHAQVGVSIAETKLNQLKLRQKFKERANMELRDIQTELEELRESITVAEDIHYRTNIRAPSDGVVQNVSVSTDGSVIRPGEVLMEIVPPDDNLLVIGRVSPIDIDNVEPGQKSEVRFTAFNAKLTPVVLGYVESISQDVIIPDRNGDEPYYLARVRIPEENLSEDMRQRLTPGMPADVVIVNGERSVLNYLVSPLTDAIAVSFREE